MLSYARASPLATAIRFCMSGGLATAVHYLTMIGAMRAGSSPATATALGAGLGALVNYVLQYHFTFASSHGHWLSSRRYLLAVALSWLLNLLFFLGLTAGLNSDVYVAQLLTTLTVALCNYHVFKHYVFK